MLASTDLSSLLLLVCVPGTTRGAGWGCALYFPWVLGTPISHLRGLFQGRYTRTHAARIIRRYFRVRHAHQVLPSLAVGKQGKNVRIPYLGPKRETRHAG